MERIGSLWSVKKGPEDQHAGVLPTAVASAVGYCLLLHRINLDRDLFAAHVDARFLAAERL